MEEINNQPNLAKQKSVFNSVTPFSKILAAVLFIMLPFVGGWVGYNFAPEKVVEVEKVVYKETNQTSEPIEEDIQNQLHEIDQETESLVAMARAIINNATNIPKQHPISTSSKLTFPELREFKAGHPGPSPFIIGTPKLCVPAPDKDQGVGGLPTQADIDLMKSLEVGKSYGSFVYVGYICHFSSPESGTPALYFYGLERFVGNDIATLMGGIEHFKLKDSDIEKLPEFAQDTHYGYVSFDYNTPNLEKAKYDSAIDMGIGPTSTIDVIGIRYGWVYGGYQSYYGGVEPVVVEASSGQLN